MTQTNFKTMANKQPVKLNDVEQVIETLTMLLAGAGFKDKVKVFRVMSFVPGVDEEVRVSWPGKSPGFHLLARVAVYSNMLAGFIMDEPARRRFRVLFLGDEIGAAGREWKVEEETSNPVEAAVAAFSIAIMEIEGNP